MCDRIWSFPESEGGKTYLMIFGSFTRDPGSGLAGVFAHVDICEMKLKLFAQRIQVLGCCSDLAFGTKLYFWTGRTLALIYRKNKNPFLP